MPQEGMGGQEGSGAAVGRLLGAGVASVPAGATVTVAILSRRAGEQVWWGGWPVEDVAGLALGGGTGISLWLERTAIPQQFTLRATNATGVDRAVEWWIRGA